MYNEITRKLTSLTLMAIMVAGGLTFAVPGMMPTAEAQSAPELFVSAGEIGNFAGIQVIEIVVDDPDRSSTDESQGIPNVEVNGDDVLMVQGDDGAWYAYIANNIAVAAFDAGAGDITNIYGEANTHTSFTGSDAIVIYNATSTFLDGSKDISPTGTVDNNPEVDAEDWPFIQTYDITENSQVTITYGTGSTAETVIVTYDYDDSKDISLDRNRYPASSLVIFELDDSLLNLSPTADDYWAFNSTDIFYFQDDDTALAAANEIPTWADVGFEEGPISFNVGSSNIFSIQNTTIHDTIREVYPGQEGMIIIGEQTTNDNVFVNYDDNELGNIIINSDDSITGAGTIEFNDNHSVILDTFNAFIEFGQIASDWLSGVEIDLELTDEDRNLNSLKDEDLLILDNEVPYISIGNPITIDEAQVSNSTHTITLGSVTDSKVATLNVLEGSVIFVNATWPTAYQGGGETHVDDGEIFPFINYDFTKFGGPQGTLFAGNSTGLDTTAGDADATSETGVVIHSDATKLSVAFTITAVPAGTPVSANAYADVLFFGQEGAVANTDGEVNDNIDRVNDAFYRFELEETDDNTAKFEGSLEYIMINQLNVDDVSTYEAIDTADDSIVIIVNDDLDGADAVRVSYNDRDSTGSDETISVQEDANTHSGVIELDKTSYTSGNTITITLTDFDLNTDSDTPQIYEVFDAQNWVGNAGVFLGLLQFDDRPFEGCGTAANPLQKDLGLNDTSFSLIETGAATGIFEGTLKLPTHYCNTDTTNSTTNGVDIEFVYQDFSDASGNPNETTASATVRSSTGSVSFDRTVFPVPFDATQFPHYGIAQSDNTAANNLPAGDTKLVILVNDPDFNVSASGEDTLPVSTIDLEISRGSLSQPVTLPTTDLVETKPDSGIFELEVLIPQDQYEGLAGTLTDGETDQIEQGDILSVTYTDPADASGESNTVTDSAAFDLRNGVLQTDKSVYIIGSDAIITLIEPDLNLDSETAETHSLDLINWDSDAGDINLSDNVFDAEPAGLRETGENSGIFQVVIEIPDVIGTDRLERGEEIELEYIDHGPAGANFVGDDEEDINLIIFTSNFGATIELDQKVYTWTDKVFVTIVAPDHNFDSDAIDEIGADDDAELNVSTRESEIDNYKLVETGSDTGIFTGEIILTGFDSHDADGDGTAGDATGDLVTNGPTSGKLPTGDDDGLTFSFEFSDDEFVYGTALIRWNIGEIQWLEASYPATGTGVIRVIDPDMNLNPESVDSFPVNVWSDTATGGINLDVTETNEATGIFEGTVFFTVNQASSGARLAVNEGDTVTAEYEDHTLPDPYSTADELDITATSVIGTIVPPLERAPISNIRAIDAFSNTLDTIGVDQQVQIAADIHNGQDRNQEFAYLVQVQDQDGVTVSLSWLTGSLTPGQTLEVAASWIPLEMGTYTATAFAWQSVDNPTALSPPAEFEITVN